MITETANFQNNPRDVYPRDISNGSDSWAILQYTISAYVPARKRINAMYEGSSDGLGRVELISRFAGHERVLIVLPYAQKPGRWRHAARTVTRDIAVGALSHPLFAVLTCITTNAPSRLSLL